MADKYSTFPDPKRLRVVEKVRALLEKINPDNEYAPGAAFPVDLRGNVFVGRLTLTTDESQDAMSILENPRPLDADGVGWDKLLRAGDFILLIQGWPLDNIRHPSRPAYKLAAMAEMMLSRIVKVDSKGDPVYEDDFLLGFDPAGDREIESIIIGQSVVRPPSDANTRLSMFYLPLTIRMITDPSKPHD